MREDLTGKEFYWLTALEWESGTHRKPGGWRCLCKCGKKTLVQAHMLLNGSIKSCGCYKSTGVLHKQFIKSGTALRVVYSVYRRVARDKDYLFGFSPEEFEEIITKPCRYCGAQPANISKSRHEELKYNGIDRIDSGRGYEKDNCVPCCKACNYAKQRMTVKEFSEWVARIYHHLWLPVPQVAVLTERYL